MNSTSPKKTLKKVEKNPRRKYSDNMPTINREKP